MTSAEKMPAYLWWDANGASAAAAAAAAAAAGPAAFWKPLVLDTVVLRRCRVRVCVPHGGGAPSGASVHGLLRLRRAHHPAADGRTLAAPAHRCLAPLGRARGALRRVPVHADDGGPRAVAAPSGALVGSRRLWYSMLNVPVRCEVVLKFRAATSTLPKHEDTRGSNISKTEHSTVSPLSDSSTSLFYV